MVALVGLRQKKQVVELWFSVATKLVVGGEINLTAIDGLDVLARFLFDLLARLAQLGHTRHDAVIGDGNGGHVQLSRSFHHVFDVRHAVKQGVLRVIMQMNECHAVPP